MNEIAKRYATEQPVAAWKIRGRIDNIPILVASQSHLPLSIIQSMEEVEKEGFPRKTIGPENPQRMGTVDWNVAMWQIATWSVAGTIVPIDKRFDDLISRHVDNPNSPYRFTRDEWLGMRDWGKERIEEICNHLGIGPKRKQ